MLPRYTNHKGQTDIEDDHEPLLKSYEPRVSTETLPPTYPPSGPSTQAEERVNVGYRYQAIYPRKKEPKNAVGVLCKTKEGTIQYVQRRFPELGEIDPSRFSFQYVPEGALYWCTIFDEAWDHFQKDPPKRLNIVIEDEAGEKEHRDRRSKIIGATIVLTVVFMLAMIPVLIHLFPQQKPEEHHVGI